MGEVKLAFLVQQPQYKGETSRLAITHAIAYQTVEIFLDDGDIVTPTLSFIGEGVLGLTKDQMAMEAYGIKTSVVGKNLSIPEYVRKKNPLPFKITEMLDK